MPKNLNKMSIEGMYPNIVKKKKKSIYNKPTTNIILNGEKLKAFFSKIRSKMFTHFLYESPK